MINEGEARELTGTSNLILESQRLLEKSPRDDIIKPGRLGAMFFKGQVKGWQLSPAAFFHSAAFLLHEVADPIGAGDTFLGH